MKEVSAMHNKVKDTAFLGLCVSLALGLAYLEMLMPPLFASVPGIKMGLPNIILIFLLYRPVCLRRRRYRCSAWCW